MNKRPLAVICVFFIFGILLAASPLLSKNFLRISVVTLIFILSSVIFSRYQKTSSVLLLLSVTSFAALLYINSNVFPNNHISHFLDEGVKKAAIAGIIRSPALTRKPYFGKINSSYLFEIEGIEDGEEWIEVKGLARIRIQAEKDYRYGDRLLVRGAIRKPGQPVIANEAKQSHKGEIASLSAKKRGGFFAMTRRDFNYRKYLERQNIFALINTREHNVTLLSHNYKSNPILRYTYSIRERLKNRILEKMPLESGAFLRAILLGDRSELPKSIRASFKRAGTMHILAISGLHVGIIALVVISLLRFLRIKREFSYIFTILFLIFFALLTLSGPSVIRAVVMACVFLIGMLLGRKTDLYNSLGIAALVILIRNPKDIFNVGFQLSFLAVVSILYFVPKFMRLIKEDTNFYLKRYLYAPLAVSISAWLGTFPLILWYFRIITPVGIISNIFVIPVLFILLIGGVGFLLLGGVGFAGTFLAGFNNLCANLIFSITDFFASLKFGHFYM